MIAKLNESNKLVEMCNKLTEHSPEKLKKFECLDLDAKLILFNKLVDNLKYENESLKMHTKCLIVKPNDKKEENLCYNLFCETQFCAYYEFYL